MLQSSYGQEVRMNEWEVESYVTVYLSHSSHQLFQAVSMTRNIQDFADKKRSARQILLVSRHVVICRGDRRLKLYLEAWRRHHSRLIESTV